MAVYRLDRVMAARVTEQLGRPLGYQFGIRISIILSIFVHYLILCHKRL